MEEAFKLTPKVDETQEFIEIANDFSNPLEIVREAISNSFDARAKIIRIAFCVIKEYGADILKIEIEDNGTGMEIAGLQSFFDLGNSLRRNDPEAIGEKGHGTKVYFNSSRIELITHSTIHSFSAVVNEPYKQLCDRKLPDINVTQTLNADNKKGTKISIYGYNNNRRDKFTHEILLDYIKWFSKFSSFETTIAFDRFKDVELEIKGLNRDTFEKVSFGHFFPKESPSIEKLFETHLVRAPEYYCKRVVRKGQLKNHPEISYDAVFSIEGNRIKQNYNPMLRRPGYQAPQGAYTVQDRYGLWLCKDFIPIQRRNEWMSFKGYEYTKFHAFFNCQGFRLTANRGSIDNTPSEILQDIQEEVKTIVGQILESNDWRSIEWLEEEANAYMTTEKENNDFKWRMQKVNQSNIAQYDGLTLVEPKRESGVFSIVLQLITKDKSLFPFTILDYDTHSGIDVIVKDNSPNPIINSKLYYIEFKHYLTASFNHSFENLFSIICWDTEIKHGELLKDINGEERKLQIIAPEKDSEYTKYFLDNPKKAHKIEVFVLKDYLKQKLKVDFRPRTADSVE